MNLLDYDHAKFVGRAKDIKLILDKAREIYNGASMAPEKRVVHFIDHANIGKTWLFRELEYQFNCKEQGHYKPLLWQITETNRGNKGKFVMDLRSCFADKLGVNLIGGGNPNDIISSEIRQISNQELIIIMIDDIDQFERDQIKELEGLLTGIISSEKAKTMIMFAGRKTVLHWAHFDLRPDSANTFPLSPFGLDDTITQLTAAFPVALPTDKIHKVSGGNPGYNYLIANDIVSGINDPFDELKAVKIFTKILCDAISEDMYQELMALSVLKSFDDVDEMAPILETYSGMVWEPMKCSELLRKILQPFKYLGVIAQWDGDDYVIDPQIRRMLELELELTDKAMWKSLHCTAYQMYKDWTEDTPSQRYYDAQKHHAERLKDTGISLDTCKPTAEEEKIQ